MPRYDFKCPACGKVFEEVTPMSQDRFTCTCGGEAVRQVSAPWQKIDINSDRWVNRHKKRW